MKQILFAASESVPFIKTGGLADVVGSLPKYFDKEKYDVRVMLPKYLCMKEEWRNQLQYKTHFYMDLNWRTEYVGILELQYEGITFYFIDNEYYFSGRKPPHEGQGRPVRLRLCPRQHVAACQDTVRSLLLHLLHQPPVLLPVFLPVKIREKEDPYLPSFLQPRQHLPVAPHPEAGDRKSVV